MKKKTQEILNFWFGPDRDDPLKNQQNWWKKDPSFDREIGERFKKDLEKAAAGKYESWRKDPEACLALIILLDQFSRNIYRGLPKAFSQDPLAQKICLKGLGEGLDQKLPPIYRVFFYMPLMHAENQELQWLGVKIFKQLSEDSLDHWKETLQNNHKYALQHAQIIERFGRFPHRNVILGRASTPEELEFLKQPGSSF